MMPATKIISEQALQYLDAQRLPRTPQNYWLAFAYQERPDSELGKALTALNDGRVRITQAAADALYKQFFGRNSDDAPFLEQARRTNDAMRHQALRLADLAGSATTVTGEFSQELTRRLPDITAVNAQGLAEIVTAALDRSRRAEQELAATSKKVDQLRQQLEASQGDAERDALTNLPNRRGIEAYFAQLPIQREPLFVAMCDIDHFKSYNDRYGHAVGDRVLKTVAQSLRETLQGCFVGRWGGEEFIVVGNFDVGAGVTLLDSAKVALGDRHFRLRETDEPMGRVTFSAGLAAVLPGDSPATQLERADALLYKAKAAGRDRVLAE